ncbi:MAG: phage terminase large subunit family protein [Ktedonobacterales bacterium]
MGRRWGKTVLGASLVCSYAATGGRCAWVVPEYKNGRPLWRMVRQAMAPLAAKRRVRISETERTVTFDMKWDGGFLGMYTGDDNCDAMRGEAFDLVVVDEAAKLSELAWTDAIVPTLADRDGKAVLISTPRGRNWFWRWWMQGQDAAHERVRSFTAPSSANPLPTIQRAAEMARGLVSERTYRQEWLAEFVEDGGGVFRAVRANVRGALEARPPSTARRYVMGVDLGKMADYTVCIVADVEARRVVAFERFNAEDYPLQKRRIHDLATRWNNARLWVDATGVGTPICDDLRRAGLHVKPYVFTNASKLELVENAVLLMEEGQISYPEIPVLLMELEALEYSRLPSGQMRVAAPQGAHDDAAMAFLLMCWPLGRRTVALPGDLLTRHALAPISGIGGQTILDKTF